MKLELLKKKLPDRDIFTRQDICEIAAKIETGFKETELRNILEKLLREGYIARVAQNKYMVNHSDKAIYENRYSEEAEKVVVYMKEQYPLLNYRIWEVNWLNEFWNHQIAQNKIFVEVENMGCDFVYTTLSEKYQGRILLKPSENELYRYGRHDTIIIDRLVSEAPKGLPERFNTPLEKIIVDLFANQKLKSMIHIGEYAKAISDMFQKYSIDQSKMLRYANRRNKRQEIICFLKNETDIKLYVEENKHA